MAEEKKAAVIVKPIAKAAAAQVKVEEKKATAPKATKVVAEKKVATPKASGAKKTVAVKRRATGK